MCGLLSFTPVGVVTASDLLPLGDSWPGKLMVSTGWIKDYTYISILLPGIKSITLVTSVIYVLFLI